MRPQAMNVADLVWPLIGLVVALAILLTLVFWIRSWLRENEDPAGSTHELLIHTRELVRQGELSDEEFRLIKGRLATHLGPNPTTPPTAGSNDI